MNDDCPRETWKSLTAADDLFEMADERREG